jgi:hypothetical protein
VVYNRELLMTSIEVPETCWANHKCNKNHWVASSWFFISLTSSWHFEHRPVYYNPDCSGGKSTSPYRPESIKSQVQHRKKKNPKNIYLQNDK